MEKGRKRLDVADLRADLGERVSLLQRSKIVTALDGNNTLLMSPTRNGSDR
jgi:Lhr-like helicase